MVEDRTIAPVLAIRRGAERTVVRLHPALAARYRATVAAAAPRIEAALGERVLANRVAAASVDPPILKLHRWRLERSAFSRRLIGLARDAGALVFIDVRRCYESITPHVVGARLRELGIEPVSGDAIQTFLEGLRPLGVIGLPVGPAPSAVLANAVLASLDRALEETGIAHLRWVDDVVAAVDGAGEAEVLLGLVDRSLTRLGLERNEPKTRIVLEPGSAVAHRPSGRS